MERYLGLTGMYGGAEMAEEVWHECVCTQKMFGKGLNTADIKISPLQHMEMMEKAILFASPQMDFSQCCVN